jgi:SAM-dependent methyltransferase
MSNTEFTDTQYSSAYPEGIQGHYWSKARNYVIEKTILAQGLSGKHMLEVGCGTGVVLRALRRKGHSVIGTELAQTDVPDDLQDVMWTGIGYESLDTGILQKIQVVLLFDVIEHIEDEIVFLQEMRRDLPNLTHVVVTVPARPELWSNYDKHYGHFRRYTRTTLGEATKRAGLVTTYVSYFFHALYIPAKLLSFFKLNRRVDVHPPRNRITSFLHKLLGRIFLMEHNMLPNALRGTSIIGVLSVRK